MNYKVRRQARNQESVCSSSILDMKDELGDFGLLQPSFPYRVVVLGKRKGYETVLGIFIA